jgi:quercetin dioxygenase-like cupin family protein
MKTIEISTEEMNARTARFKKLDSYQTQQANNGIPQPILEKIAARRVYPVMVPKEYTGRSASAPLKGLPGLAVTIAECPPGDGPGLHNHETTTENFFCLNGKFEISWGDDGENSIVLDPLDMVSVPPGIHRRFKNVSDETARLLVMIQIPTKEQADRISYAPALGAEIEKEYGAAALQKLRDIGFKFDAGSDAPAGSY